MSKEIYPSSYVCDCGEQFAFGENTVRELKEKSHRRRQALIADDDAHEIIFDYGQWVAIWCPKEEREIAANPRRAGRR